MDAGAHFHCCDLQVHTPRDAQWTGTHPCTDEERKAFAGAFIQHCRTKGLDAVAITDHHDLAFFPYIKEAAQTEVDEAGNPVPEDEQIVVFPGMELTLGVPCQALLVLDASFDERLLTQLYGALAITPVDPCQPKLPPCVTRLDHVTTLQQLHDELDRLDFLRGRYIVLPNVSDGGNATLLRKGNHAKYRDMPCVGGYVDKSADDIGRGNADIVNGRSRDHGFKSIGLIQTSDSRRDDCRDLAAYPTWIKWATPTAEALRQACLARQTRLFHAPPDLPPTVVEAIRVSNCKFLGPFDLEFNPQFNCLIGGRGTGKSTILEYLRWALCDQPPAVGTSEEVPDFQVKRSGMIRNTLAPHEAVVTVSFIVNGVRHVVRRHSHTGDLFLKIGEREFDACREDDVRDLLPVQAYSQKQLSAVGVRTEELIRFIQAPVKQALRELSGKVDNLKATIRTAYGVMQRQRQLQREIRQGQLAVESLTKQTEALRTGLTGLSPEDQAILARHDKIGLEEQTLGNWQRDLDRAAELVRDVSREMANMPSPVPDTSVLPNGELVKEIGQQTETVMREARQHIDAALRLLSGSGEPVEKLLELRRTWKGKHDAHVVEHTDVKKRATAHEARLKQIEEAEGRVKTTRGDLTTRQATLDGLGNPESEYRQAWQGWVDIYRERADLLETKCKELTLLSSEAIRATLRRGAGVEQAADRLKGLLVGTSIRAKKTEDLFEAIAGADDPVVEWNGVLSELETLTLCVTGQEDSFEAPATPVLGRFYNSTDIERIARKLTIEEWVELSLTELNDIPVFEYRQGEMDYIAFADASAGQQATALLRVLLNQDGPPLVIDQPEEDLDNQVMQEIVQEIWRAKRRRQIIVSSHNANIVVNGDADLVICCDYRTAGDQSGGRIKCQGAIDVDAINKEITNVMEGGKEAFRLRKAKYGF